MTLSAEPPLILVVDDDPGSRDVAARLLEREGYRTRQAESATNACASWPTGGSI